MTNGEKFKEVFGADLNDDKYKSALEAVIGMTTDVQEIKRAYEVLAFSGHVDDQRKAAFDNAIKALEEVERYKQAIEKIKSELNDDILIYYAAHTYDSWESSWRRGMREGLEESLDVINKHLKGVNK